MDFSRSTLIHGDILSCTNYIARNQRISWMKNCRGRRGEAIMERFKNIIPDFSWRQGINWARIPGLHVEIRKWGFRLWDIYTMLANTFWLFNFSPVNIYDNANVTELFLWYISKKHILSHSPVIHKQLPGL